MDSLGMWLYINWRRNYITTYDSSICGNSYQPRYESSWYWEIIQSHSSNKIITYRIFNKKHKKK
jgi:hypothetical protein